MSPTPASIVRKLARIALLAASLGCRTASGETTGAAATSTTSTRAPEVALLGKDGRWNAPVGHRQPRARDLPSEQSGEVEHINDEDRAVDRKLIICRGC
ncbi:MAG TPA: hypothetical protein VKY22_27155 [Bradyrhizobium sp.]|nr:hypothetical protein [Bradyrhizobium sp.]